ncbi:MAG: metallophosphoesterase [Wenzhouxiangella sp.]
MSSLPATDPRPFCLLQLSDSHLSADPQARYRGENADQNLARLRPAIRELAPDAIVLSGDVSEDGSQASYWRMAGFVHDLAGTVAWLPGNHDVRETMEKVFAEPGFHAGPVLDCGGWQIVLLDSSWPDRIDGCLDGERLEPLERLAPGRPALVFVHHQPVKVGSPWIDRYPLSEADRLWHRLDRQTVRAVAFGHVHQAFESEREGIAVLASPASSVNSLPGEEKFTPDPAGPSARWFRLWPDGRWETGLVQARHHTRSASRPD